MRTPELKRTILKIAGMREFYGYELHKKLEGKKINVGIGRLYSILGEMKEEGFLKDRWEKSQNGPKRRVYQTGVKGGEERDRILMEAIKTVHEFYTEYLLNLPKELSVFKLVVDLLTESLSEKENAVCVATRFSGPVREIISSLQEKFDGNIYAIHPREDVIELKIENVSVLYGTFGDIPVKDSHLDLLIVTGNITEDNLESNLIEWQRAINENGTLAIVTPTALLVDFKDPVDIGEFIERREHPRSNATDSLNLETLSTEMRKYFKSVEIDKVIHITVLRGLGPFKNRA